MYSRPSTKRSIVMYVGGIEVWENLKMQYELKLDMAELQKLQDLIRDNETHKKILDLKTADELMKFILFSK